MNAMIEQQESKERTGEAVGMSQWSGVPPVCLDQADAYLQSGLVPEAEEIYLQILEGEDSLAAQVGLARCAYARRDLHEALGRLQAVAAVDDCYPGMANDLGVVYFELGLPKEAEEQLLAAADQSEGDPVPWRNLVDVACSLHDAKACETYCEKLLALDPGNSEVEALLLEIRQMSTAPAEETPDR